MSKRSTGSGSVCCPEVGTGDAAAGSASPAAATGARGGPFPGLAFGLAGLVLGASVLTGSLWHELPARFAGGGSFGWPALQAGRWWTLASSLILALLRGKVTLSLERVTV